jgi:hypothetical protein
MHPWEEHGSRVGQVAERLAAWRLGKTSLEELCERSSHVVRKQNYHSPPLQLHSLNQLLEIDPVQCTARVEPGMTMEQLASACLPFGLMPAVVPEFKGISVGGAINGAALESTSHRYGQFNDCCLGYEVLLGDGQVEQVTPGKNPEHFYAMSGSYGTLGFLLSADIKLVPAKDWIKVSYVPFRSVEEAIDFMRKRIQASDSTEMMEAIVFDQKKSVVIYGSHVSEIEAEKLPKRRFGRFWDPWFFGHAASTKHHQEAIPIRDYLFRHDRGAFWMGGFGTYPSLLLRYWIHRLGWTKNDQGSHLVPKSPGALYRYLFGWLAASRSLYSSLYQASEWVEKNFVIQDFYLPEDSAAAFANRVLDKYAICPLWLCPVKPTQTPQIFSPHYQPDQKLLFNVGVYGIPFASDGPSAVRDLEEALLALRGKKMLYSHTYLSQDEFWSIYPYDSYRKMRQRFCLEGLIPDITDKLLKPEAM